jgi:DNA repair photolyase
MPFKTWNTVDVITENGEAVPAIAPIIVSASRATDIPALYSTWFFNRLAQGYVRWKNPFNNQTRCISFDKTRAIVFWTKNSAPMHEHLDQVNDRGINYYFQYTVNDYEGEALEPGLPPIKQRIKSFHELSRRIGKERVIWRFDPLLLSDKISTKILIDKINNLGNQLAGSTAKLVISFVDIERYAKVKKRLGNRYWEMHHDDILQIGECIARFNEKWKLEISTCAEDDSLEQFGITHTACVDGKLLARLFSHDKALMEFLFEGKPEKTISDEEIWEMTRRLKDKGQRKQCRCIVSKDIGQYSTCAHLCAYCYANSSSELALKSFSCHKADSETIAD